MLVHEKSCVRHADIPDVEVELEISTGYSKPETLHSFTSTITEDPRLTHGCEENEESKETVYIKLSDMEVIIENKDKDPIEKFEYNDPEKIPKKTEDSINWIVENY